VFHYWLLVNSVVVLVIVILSYFSFKNIFNRYGLFKFNRREFYECGFKPFLQKPIKLSLQFLLICIFFVLYDIELLFSYPFVSYISNHSLLDSFMFGFMYGTFVLSLSYDFDRYLTKWKI